MFVRENTSWVLHLYNIVTLYNGSCLRSLCRWLSKRKFYLPVGYFPWISDQWGVHQVMKHIQSNVSLFQFALLLYNWHWYSGSFPPSSPSPIHVQALCLTIGCSEWRDMELCGRSLSSLLDLMLNQASQVSGDSGLYLISLFNSLVVYWMVYGMKYYWQRNCQIKFFHCWIY